MDFDYIADNEDQMYRELLESEEKEKNKDKKKTSDRKNNYRNNYDDESRHDV